jgi:hypothetical protein
MSFVGQPILAAAAFQAAFSPCEAWFSAQPTLSDGRFLGQIAKPPKMLSANAPAAKRMLVDQYGKLVPRYCDVARRLRRIRRIHCCHPPMKGHMLCLEIGFGSRNSATVDHMRTWLERTLLEHEHELTWLWADPICAGDWRDPRFFSIPERPCDFQPRPGMFA